MWKIILGILAAVGRILLILLALAGILIACLLFTPFCYRADIKKDQEVTDIRGKLTWLWFVLRASVRYGDDGLSYEVRLLGIPLVRLIRWIRSRKGKNKDAGEDGQSGGNEQLPAGAHKAPTVRPGRVTEKTFGSSAENADKAAQDCEPPRTTSPEAQSARNEQAAQAENSTGDGHAAQTEDSARNEQAVQKEQNEPNEQETELPEEKAGLFRKAAGVIRRIFGIIAGFFRGAGRVFAKIRDVFRNLRAALRRLSDILKKVIELYKDGTLGGAFAVLKKHIMAIVRHIRPRRIKGSVIFGFEDPAATGKTLGLISVFLGYIPEKLHLQPDFTQKRLEADVHISGHFFLIVLLVHALKILFDKNIRKLLKLLKKNKRKAHIQENS